MSEFSLCGKSLKISSLKVSLRNGSIHDCCYLLCHIILISHLSNIKINSFFKFAVDFCDWFVEIVLILCPEQNRYFADIFICIFVEENFIFNLKFRELFQLTIIPDWFINGLAPDQYQAIIWNNTYLSFTGIMCHQGSNKQTTKEIKEVWSFMLSWVIKRFIWSPQVQAESLAIWGQDFYCRHDVYLGSVV